MHIILPIVVVFFLALLIMPIFCKVYFTFDVINNIGVISLYVFFIKIIAYKIKRVKNQLVLYTEVKKKEIELEITNKQLRFIKQLTVQLKEKVVFKSVDIYYKIGLNDAYYTAIWSGIFNVIVSSILGYIKNIKKSCKMRVYNFPEYNGINMIASINIKCFITLFDIIYAIFMSFLIIRRSEKYERI